MPKIELEHNQIKAMKAPDEPIEYFDTIEKGLILRLSKAGSKTFTYRYRSNGKNKQFKIGKFPDVSLSIARESVRNLRVQVDVGIDPQVEKRKKRYKPDEATFKQLAERYSKRHLPELREPTVIEYQRIIDKELNPILGNYSAKEVTRKQIIDLLDEVAIDRGTAVLSNRIRAVLSSIYTFGIDKAILEANPVLTIKRKKKTKNGEKVEKRRKRFYTHDELKELWNAFSVQSEPVRSLFFILLLCSQRYTETRKMKWEYIDFDKQTWTIPEELTKAKRKQVVPLSNQAFKIIEALKENSNSEYVFTTPRKNDEPIQWMQKAVERVRKLSDVNDFRIHDLRRTGATYMAELKIDRTVLGKVLNHKELAGDNQVTAIYDRHDYLVEKRKALQLWANHLEQILTGKKAKITKIG